MSDLLSPVEATQRPPDWVTKRTKEIERRITYLEQDITDAEFRVEEAESEIDVCESEIEELRDERKGLEDEDEWELARGREFYPGPGEYGERLIDEVTRIPPRPPYGAPLAFEMTNA